MIKMSKASINTDMTDYNMSYNDFTRPGDFPKHENTPDALTESLTKTIMSKMKEIGNTDVKISNIRFFHEAGKQYAFADISYTWYLNAWGKQVTHNDMIFALIDNQWCNPLFLY
jgi:hypothetical protein